MIGKYVWYSRIAPSAFIPELLPEGGSVFNPEHACAERAGKGSPAAAGRHAGRHAVLGRRALGDKGDASCRAAQPLRLRP